MRILCAVWRNWKLCVFGIHVTAPFEKCIKAIAELVGPSLGTQSRDRHPNLSGEDGRGAAAHIVEGLKCTTVPLHIKNKCPARPC